MYVTGAVRKPGVYQLEQGDRLADAVDSAGGAVEGAQLDLVNLSLRVVDQGHYRIPRLGEAPGDVVMIPGASYPGGKRDRTGGVGPAGRKVGFELGFRRTPGNTAGDWAGSRQSHSGLPGV